MCVSVCVCEIERERKSVCVCLYLYELQSFSFIYLCIFFSFANPHILQLSFICFATEDDLFFKVSIHVFIKNILINVHSAGSHTTKTAKKARYEKKKTVFFGFSILAFLFFAYANPRSTEEAFFCYYLIFFIKYVRLPLTPQLNFICLVAAKNFFYVSLHLFVYVLMFLSSLS